MVNNPTAEYWKKRFEQLEQSQHNMGVQAYADIEQQYRKAQRQIEGQINAWYGRFANNNNVTIEEARRMLTAKELDELKWDVHEYIKYAEDNAISGQWVKELENASTRYHISRLEALKLQTQQSLEVMFGNQLDTFDETMSQVYKSGFYRTAFELQKGIGVGWDFGTLDDAQIAKVINKPWAVDGRNFSQRIWGNKTKLINELNQTLTQNIVLGKDPQKAIDQIAKKMNTSKNNAGRLVMTEEAFFSSEAQKDCFKELDVEEYEIVATLDGHTSEICQEMDGKHFEMSKWEVGATAPPFHVYCRSTTVPYFADDFGQPGERAARMADGEPTYHVPANMTYKQWQKSFLGGGDKSGLNKVQSGGKIKPKEHSEAFNELKKMIDANKIPHRPVKHYDKQPSEEKIIERLAGGDMTKGSCSSLAFAYCGNKNGLDVLDFRGGDSQLFFSINMHIQKILDLPGVTGRIEKVKKEALGTWKILKELELNKEYYLATGKHAAIVRRTEKGVEYLELQSKKENGWMPFEGNKRYDSPVSVLMKRFGCRKTVDKSFGKVWEKKVVLMEVDSFKDNDEFEELLGYINTATDAQKKGVLGDVK